MSGRKPLVVNKKLTLKCEEGKGAWTYQILIPDTAFIEGKWGLLKVYTALLMIMNCPW